MATSFPAVEPSPPLILTSEQINWFHAMDRNLYTRLTQELLRDPLESMRVMALWLWLETFWHCHLVKDLLRMPDFLIDEIADEAMVCINYLDFTPAYSSRGHVDLPMTQSLLGNDVSLYFFSLNRDKAISGMGKASTEVCQRALLDLMQLALGRNAARVLDDFNRAMFSIVEPGSSLLNLSSTAERVTPNQPEAVHPNERTMFVIFSNGNPIRECDIREFFNIMQGKSIESLHMERVQPHEKPLYARIVFYAPSAIKEVLDGVGKMKITIKGKQMLVRKFVSKSRRSSPPPAMLRPFGQ